MTQRTYHVSVVLLSIAILAALAWPSIRDRDVNVENSTPNTVSRPQSTTSSTTTEPDQPCRVEAPASARAAAQNWCQGGVFTLVNVSNDANNFVVLLQFSNKGQATWMQGKLAVLNRFRLLTDEMVEKTDMNVAFSLHDTSGQMLGGCVRKRSARESTCNAP